MSALKSLCDRMRASVRATGSSAYLSLDQSEVSIVVEAAKKSKSSKTKAKPKTKAKGTATKAKAKGTATKAKAKSTATQTKAKAKSTATKKAASASAKPAAKRVTVKKPRTRKAATAIDTDVRRHMIAEAAYFRAQARGFNGGDEIADWLAAEAEIDALMPA
jgi:hypothetical protein